MSDKNCGNLYRWKSLHGIKIFEYKIQLRRDVSILVEKRRGR